MPMRRALRWSFTGMVSPSERTLPRVLASWSAALANLCIDCQVHGTTAGGHHWRCWLRSSSKYPQPLTVQITSPLNDGRWPHCSGSRDGSATDPDGNGESGSSWYWAIESGYVLIGTDAGTLRIPHLSDGLLAHPPLIARHYDNKWTVCRFRVPANVVPTFHPPSGVGSNLKYGEVVAPTTLPPSAAGWFQRGIPTAVGRSVHLSDPDQVDGGTDLYGDVAPVLPASFTSLLRDHVERSGPSRRVPGSLCTPSS